MKKITLLWTPFAVTALDQIYNYIKTETYSESIANKYVLKLINRVEQLIEFPNSGQEEILLKPLHQNSRYLIEGNYKIIYLFQNDKIIITDVFHLKQNPKKLVKRNSKK
jgi:plasmid stabilization system protein ParE